jgi:hypothetical protein
MHDADCSGSCSRLIDPPLHFLLQKSLTFAPEASEVRFLDSLLVAMLHSAVKEIHF